MAKKKGDTTIPVLAHVLGLVSSFIGPLIILLVADDKTGKTNAKLALNWQISLAIYILISIPLIFILIGFLLIPTLGILNLVFSIMGAVKAGEGKLYKYPLAIPFFKVK